MENKIEESVKLAKEYLGDCSGISFMKSLGYTVTKLENGNFDLFPISNRSHYIISDRPYFNVSKSEFVRIAVENGFKIPRDI